MLFALEEFSLADHKECDSSKWSSDFFILCVCLCLSLSLCLSVGLTLILSLSLLVSLSLVFAVWLT